MSPSQLEETWESHGSRAAASTFQSASFVQQQLAPFVLERSVPAPGPVATLTSEEEFWTQTAQRHGRPVLNPFSSVTLSGFTLSDWFPRTPGMYWSSGARAIREDVLHTNQEHDPHLGGYYRPESKMNLVEYGGLGTVRLLPKRIEGERCWFATALTQQRCEAGIPLAIPEALLRKTGFEWGRTATLRGRLQFVQDADLQMIAGATTGVRPMIVFVEDLQCELARPAERTLISPVVLFNRRASYHDPYFAFAQCYAGDDAELDSAGEWMEAYSAKYEGIVITNFDEQRPMLADAPLSYQRLVAKTYDRKILKQYGGDSFVERVDTIVVQQSFNIHGDMLMRQNNVRAGGNAIVNIDSSLSNVNQTIAASSGLDAKQQSELAALVLELRNQLKPLETSHSDEVQEVAEAADKAVTAASKPETERKKPFLDLKASQLLDAAKLLAGVAPMAVHAAEKIGAFLQNL